METKNGNPVMEKSVYIGETNCMTPLGFDLTSNIYAIMNGLSGIKTNPKDSFPLARLNDDQINAAFDKLGTPNSYSRLEKMMILALYPVVQNKHITNKSALIISTTKGNISYLENQNVEQATLGTLAKKIAVFFGFSSTPIVISNACVSGVMALSVGKRLLQYSDYSEVFIVAGDEITEFVLSGFKSFQALSNDICKPFDKERNGINLGEAAAAAYLSTETAPSSKVKILGDASINDANHISGPSRTGEGLFRSIRNTFKACGIKPDEIGFISAHGTATVYNDEMESIAFERAGMSDIPIFSLKANYGHTLGTSGLLETIISVEALLLDKIPKSLGYREKGISGSITISEVVQDKKNSSFLKTASGFGGSNTSILFEKI